MPISIPLDFEGVPERGSIRVPEGDYLLKIVKIDKTKSKSSGNPMLVLDFEFASGPKGVIGKRGLKDRHVLLPENLWTLRNLLEAIGYNVPAGKMKLEESMLVGKFVGARVIDGEEYEKKIKSEIADYLPKESVGNAVSSDASVTDEDEDDDPFDTEDEPDDEPEEEEDTEPESDDSDDDDEFAFDDEEEEETPASEPSLSFSASDVSTAKAPELKAYLKEAMEDGWEFDLGSKPKASEVREALLAIFEDEDGDDDDMEEFSLDDA